MKMASAFRRGRRGAKDLARAEEFELIVQVNGKLRGRLLVNDGFSESEVKDRALAEPRVVTALAGQRVVRVVVVPKKLVNIVIQQAARKARGVGRCGLFFRTGRIH